MKALGNAPLSSTHLISFRQINNHRIICFVLFFFFEASFANLTDFCLKIRLLATPKKVHRISSHSKARQGKGREILTLIPNPDPCWITHIPVPFLFLRASKHPPNNHDSKASLSRTRLGSCNCYSAPAAISRIILPLEGLWWIIPHPYRCRIK